MSTQRSLKMPVTLAIAMIAVLVLLTVGWVLLNVSGALADSGYAGLYWTLLSVGAVFIVFLVVGVVFYLVLTIKAIDLNRRQSNFIDSVTHELKSPIASMKLYLQTLNQREVSQEERARFYQFVLDDIERLDRLINKLLDAAAVESGSVSGEVTGVSLDGLLRECIETVCKQQHVPTSTIQVDAHPCTVKARKFELELIFRNLIDNAVKYAGTPATISVTLRSQPGGLSVTRVSNNGPGIPPKFRKRIFRRFVRLGVELEREKQGTGLGLYIVHTLVKRLRGRIRVDEAEGGGGTMFEVQLPGVQPEKAKAQSTRQAVPADPSGKEEAHADASA